MYSHLAALTATAHDAAWTARYNDGKWLFIGIVIVGVSCIALRVIPRVLRRRNAG